MNVHIIRPVHGDLGPWVSVPLMLQEHLSELGVKATLGTVPHGAADINHLIAGTAGCDGDVDTALITDVGSADALVRAIALIERGALGICLSRDTQERLRIAGVPPAKMALVHPAHDGLARPRQLRIGVTSKTFGDGRKRENLLVKVAAQLDPRHFSFEIMGTGWAEVVRKIERRGFSVLHHEQFSLEKCRSIVPHFDFYLYLGRDEGSMGFLDALAAGVATIVTAQGFHLDVPGGITWPVDADPVREIAAALMEANRERLRRSAAVADWTWPSYTRRHLELWTALLAEMP